MRPPCCGDSLNPLDSPDSSQTSTRWPAIGPAGTTSASEKRFRSSSAVHVEGVLGRATGAPPDGLRNAVGAGPGGSGPYGHVWGVSS